MAENVLLTLVRLLLPLALMFASLARPVAISILYSAMFLASPWLMQSKSKSQRTVLTFYLIFAVVSGGLFALGHLTFNFTNFLFSVLESKPSITIVLRQIGFADFNGLRAIAILHWILPDIMVTVVALIILVFMKISEKVLFSKRHASETSQNFEENIPSHGLKYSEINRLLIMAYIQSFIKTSPIFSMIILYFAATLRPSLPGSLYFLVFIVAGTYWALYRPFNFGLHYPLVLVIIILTMHIICFLVYQQPIVNNSLNGESIWARIMGLEIIFLLRERNKNGTILELNNDLSFDSYLSPIAMMSAYFIITLNIVHHGRHNLSLSTIQKKINQTTDESVPDEVHQPKNASQSNLEEPSTLEQFYYMITDVTSFIYKNSYILLNIIMMIWSIIYHSWLTFVFLIWANILWMIPNQRRTMMRSSFFVVLYAEFLIITQYIYGLNLNESELPTKIRGVNVEQIGFVHPRNIGVQPCIPLAVKTSFLFIFWITSHQYFKEKAEDNDRAQDDILQQLFGPQHPRSESTFFEKSRAHRAFIFIFESVSNFITRIWMWMLIFLIFLCAMIDKVMTAFRICYMSLFLLFLMVFQMSLPLWIKFLYGYWMFVIFYAMTILTIIYTYQFDYFDYYWEKYLHVQPALQTDIGLRRYRTKELFLHLLVPTLTVIFTVIQLHYFHRRFMRAVLHPGSTDRKRTFTRVQFSQHKPAASRPLSWRTIFALSYKRLRATLYRWIRPSKLVAWRFLEMHMIKAVAFFTFVCAISEICCFNLWLVILSLISVCVNRLFRRVVFRIVSFWISVLILMKMIYQINYLNESHYDHSCNNSTVNFAYWMGLRKTEQTWGSLLRYLAPYIVYMIVTTLHAVVKLRDHLIRYSMGEIRDRTILFPQTSRQDAERNFSCLLKYLLNYGYFKFGLEITLIALVASIAHRRDVLAVTYVLWLILLLCLKRMQCARIWYIFQLYFVISIFVQYVYVIHFPPNLCLGSGKVPVQGSTNNHPFEELLEDPTKSNLLLDFIVLLFISRERKAFKAEVRQINNLSYPGGDNRNIVHNIAKLGHVYFKNPTHDFCSFVRNYSDVFKTVVFCSFLWITLAIVFLGGVCSMDMLSLGYLIFALVFLLQGSEVYLQNIHYIICRWNILIAFNVFNIVIKVCIIVFGNVLDIKHKQDYQSLFAVMEYPKSLPDLAIDKQPEELSGYHYGPNSLIFKNILVWHAIIFAFIIFQSRIFRSYYFCHIISDTQANTVLASRGAIIIENLHYKQIFDRREYERNMLKNVKTKMEIIKANNVKNYKRVRAMSIVPAVARRDQTQSQEGEENESTSQIPITSTTLRNLNLVRSSPLKRRDLRLHPHAVRSGDYYMFDDQDDGDEPILNEEYDFLDKEDMRTRQMLLSAKNKKAQNKGPSQYSSDSDIDFETNPIVKLTTELIMLVTLRLNRLSRNFRFVHKVLSAEKKTLQDISTMNRLGMVNTAAMFSFLNQSLYDKEIDSINAPTKESTEVHLVNNDAEFTTQDHNDFVQMLISMWYAIIANSEVISYLAVFINQVANSSIISLPMPFLVLYWGALTLPRPTKTFWVTLITYTLGMIFIKCIMHQKIVLDQKLIKIAKTMDFELFIKHGKAVYDLLLLVVLIWHRYMLKKQGIWNIPRSGTSPLSMKRARNKERPHDVLNRLRQESGSDLKENMNRRAESTQFERDLDDLLRPGIENKYVYENIESEYYRTTMKSLEQKGGVLSGIKKFFVALLHKARLSTDVYTLLFLCDFINFFVLLFGYPKFVYRRKYTTSVLETYIQGNRVPLNFLFMLFIQFATIVAERAIYLRKAMMAKIVFHFCTVVGIHIWMFFAVPYVTSHSFGATAPVIFYLIKCLHMLLSAYQIRCGYPKRILGNVFTKSYSMVNYVAFKVYMEIPFLYILRTLLDWLCINTTLTVMEWIKMEDIFQSVFIVRCYRQMDADFPVMRGEPKAFYAKCLIGGTIIFILIVLIWSPLFLFALVGTVGKPNVPRAADISLKIGQYEPIYVSQSYSARQFSKKDYNDLVNSFSHDIYATDHIEFYGHVDVTAAKFDANSVTLWNMLPPDKKRLLADLKSDKTIDIRLRLSFNSGGTSQSLSHETTYSLTTNKELTREMLIKTLFDENSKAKVIVPDILPKFITVQKNEVLVKYIKDFEGKHNRPVILQKKQDGGNLWWEMHDFCDDKYYRNILSNLPQSDCDGGIVFYIFNEKSFPSAMSFLEKTGIIGLYTTCVYVVSRVIRSLIANNHRRIMFEDLPFVDRILKLCNDIYLVRETKEYRLEEDLYGKLLFLYRSPETLIKWTRYKDDVVDEPSGSESTKATSPEASDDEERERRRREPPPTPPRPPTPPPP